ncbi:transposase family protein, partial [bacterium]|nr:transposase family protein [bacterium]
STIDRLLRAYKKKKGFSTTRRAEILKAKISLSIGEKRIKQPGYLQVDTVAHCGDCIAGQYVHTLTTTDLYSGWTEPRAVWGKNARDVLKEFLNVEKGLPFFILGYSSDNGGEVCNDRLYRYLNNKGVKMTRGRPYRKNDQAHVEQRNDSYVRRLFGYERFEHQELTKLMNEIYSEYWNPLQNFFTPCMKLIKKKRIGAKIVKKYDTPKTPYQRLMDCPKVPES